MDKYKFDLFHVQFFLNVFFFYFIYTSESKSHYYYLQCQHYLHFYFTHLKLLFVLTKVMS